MIKVTLSVEVEKRVNAAPKFSAAYDKVENAAREMGIVNYKLDHNQKEVTLVGEWARQDSTATLANE